MLETIFGHGKDLNTLQVSARAAALFIVALALIRIAGMRAFGRKSSFDSVIVIMLGAVLSRPVIGASPAVPTIAGCVVFVVMHRCLALLTARFPAVERLVKGRSHVVFRDGVPERDTMLRTGISVADLDETARRHAHASDHRSVNSIVIEASGELSVVDK